MPDRFCPGWWLVPVIITGAACWALIAWVLL